MKQAFRFDDDTGTIIPVTKVESAQQSIPNPPKQPIKMDSVLPQKSGATISIQEGEVTFRERSDLTIFQIVDEQTNTPLGYISGYALDIRFNLSEIKSTERIEQFLEGVKKMFREIMLKQAFSANK